MNKIRILLFDGVELLDFAGPLEVFSVADYLLGDSSTFDIKSISQKSSNHVSKSGILIVPNSTNEHHPFDLLIIPGGIGTRRIIKDKKELNYVKELTRNSQIVASVCTGALVLGSLGLLEGIEVTTHKLGVPLLERISPGCKISRSKRFVDNGNIITSAGISAGIDMSLYLLEKHHGRPLKDEVMKYMEYQY